ncbi:MAG: hypothetical protein AABY22_07830 [Nanoarchaeota archaeon]
MDRKTKQDLIVSLLAIVSGIVFVYIDNMIGTFMILGSFLISLFKRDILFTKKYIGGDDG